jgi:lysophospholipase L1-like esterase
MPSIKTTLFAAVPTIALLGVFALGFIGKPENSRWLNSSPLWKDGDPFAFYHDRMLASPVLIYRGLPDFDDGKYEHNAMGLRDDEIVSPKPPGVIRILNLGDSSTYGVGLPGREHTYSDQLEDLLRCKPAAQHCKQYDVVNAGTIGYSSLQILQFLRYYVARLEPDIITVYTGNNDWAPSGMKESERIAATASPLYEWLNKNFFYLLAQKAFLKLRQPTLEKKRAEFNNALRGLSAQQEEAYQTKSWYYRTLARATPDEFEHNLREIVRVARAHGARVILLKPAANLPWPYLTTGANIARVLDSMDPMAEFHVTPVADKRSSAGGARYWSAVFHTDDYLERVFRGGGPPCDRPFLNHRYLCLLTPDEILRHVNPQRPDGLREHEILNKLKARIFTPVSTACGRALRAHNWAVALIAAGRLTDAAAALHDVSKEFDSGGCQSLKQRAQARYTFGILHMLRGERDIAERILWEARKILPYAFSPDYAERFDRVVTDTAAESVDAFGLFREADPQFWGSRLIHDWVHPDPEGNALIAQELRKRILGGPRPL